jgi:CheY-like chemotaxis protein
LRTIPTIRLLTLKQKPDLLAVGEAAMWVEAVEKAELLLPDLIVLDLALPKLHGLARIIRELKDKRSLPCYKHVYETLFEALPEASSCLTIAQHSVYCSQEFFASL